jgi:hypothetical protein
MYIEMILAFLTEKIQIIACLNLNNFVLNFRILLICSFWMKFKA